MRCIFLLGLLLFLLTGCAHIYRLQPDSPPALLARVNGELDQSHGKVLLKSGDSLRATGFEIRADSTLCLGRGNLASVVLPNHAIRTIDALDRIPFSTSPVLTGALAGGVTGGVLGTIGGFLLWAVTVRADAERTDADDQPPGDSTWVCGTGDRDNLDLTTALVGGIAIGTTTGAVLGGTLSLLKVTVDSQSGRPVQVRFSYPLDRP